MNGYEKAIALGLTGTDTDIVNALKPLTVSDIIVSDAVEWLAENGYWQESPSGMIGTLVAIYDASTGAARKKFDDVWGWLFMPTANRLKTTRVSQADRVLFLINQIPGVTAAIRNSFFVLGGDRPYKNLTEAEFDSQRTEALAAAALQQQINDLAVLWATCLNDDGINTALSVGDKPALIIALDLAQVRLET